MASAILHHAERNRERAATLVCMARTVRAETLDLQGRLFKQQWRLLEKKLYYRYVVQKNRGAKDSGSFPKG